MNILGGGKRVRELLNAWDWCGRERQQSAAIRKATPSPGDWILDQMPLLGCQH